MSCNMAYAFISFDICIIFILIILDALFVDVGASVLYAFINNNNNNNNKNVGGNDSG